MGKYTTTCNLIIAVFLFFPVPGVYICVTSVVSGRIVLEHLTFIFVSFSCYYGKHNMFEDFFAVFGDWWL